MDVLSNFVPLYDDHRLTIFFRLKCNRAMRSSRLFVTYRVASIRRFNRIFSDFYVNFGFFLNSFPRHPYAYVKRGKRSGKLYIIYPSEIRSVMKSTTSTGSLTNCRISRVVAL